MAIFDKDKFRWINEHLEKIGYPAEFFNMNQEKKFTTKSEFNERYNIQTTRSELEGFFAEPILIAGNEKGDKWNIYFRDDNLYYWDKGRNVGSALQSIFFKDGVPSSEYYPELLVFDKVKSGGKYFDGEFIDSTKIENEGEFSSFENFDSIDAPDYSVLLGENPQVSEASRPTNVEALTESQFKKAQEKLAKCQEELNETLKAKAEGTLESAMWTFDEVDELYNKGISTEDKRAFFIYWQNKNRKKLSGGFAEKYGSSYPAQAVDIIELMKKGALFFDPTAKFGERLQPKAIYQSGNIWKKWSSLQNQKDYYIQRFGEEIYNIHVEELQEAWDEAWENRLRVSGADKTMRATILPVSDLAETIKIGDVVNPLNKSEIENNFRIYTSWKKGERVEDISGEGDGSARNNYINKKSLSLKDGFIRWCALAGSGTQAQNVGVQWSSLTPNIKTLEDYYLNPTKNPFSEEKNGEEKWARAQDDARKVGIRLFGQFLEVGLIPSDQTKVEVIFNSTYNAYKEPKLEKVPIGFTYKKYIDNRGLFILKQSNLNAIRYYLTRGSIGLAYGVGLGKTFCSIFAMKQALDLGTAKRPLVIVPNQVYFQFGQEIQRGLGKEFDPTKPNTRLNMFYNASGEIYNTLGNNAVDGINLCTYEATETFAFQQENLDMTWVTEAVNILEMGGDGAIANPTIMEGFLKSHSESLFNIEVDTDTSEDLTDDLDALENEQMSKTMTENENSSEDDLDLGDFKRGGKAGEGEDITEVSDKPKKGEIVLINSPANDFDMVVVDEAHNFNNLFSKVVSAPKEVQGGEPDKKTGKVRIRREINPYSKIRETAGGKEASARAEKLWWVSKFVQSKSPMGNTILLSATPFTNSPLQLFTMLSYLNYEMLFDSQIGIIKDFFDLFAKIEYAEDFKTDLSIIKRNKLVGWNNVVAMQKFVYRVFDKSSREDEDKAVIRPNKIVLPLKRMMVNGKLYEFSKENYISTTLKLSNLQETLWKRVKDYAGGVKDPTTGNVIRYEDVCNDSTKNTTSLGKYVDSKKKKKKLNVQTEEDAGGEVDVENADDLADGTKEGEKAKDGAKALQCLMWGRQIALNPYLFKCSGLYIEPNGKSYVESSPKLLYVMNCIKSIKEYHEKSEDSPLMSGQVIYMNFGVDAFPLLREYLVEELGFDINEIGIISGSGNYIGKKRYENKQKVADAFLGRVLDAETGKYSNLEDSKRVKVLIGSEAIKEGINLQDYASVLYNCFLDFNPTDMVQVEGRIWRQGNAFANVRIVTPLMADCIDVFMFQKLEDKTERINQIWTKNGNANELDTTSFNPAELKYELLSDPVAIATLEREYKVEKLQEQQQIESEVLGRYTTFLDVWRKGEKVLYPPIKSNVNADFRFSIYSKIMAIRPDLIDKPLWNYKEWVKFIELCYSQKIEGSRYQSVEQVLQTLGNPCLFVSNSRTLLGATDVWMNWERSQNVNHPSYREWLGKIFNYSAEQLIELMVKVMKDQKIAYPLGYSSNWRDLLPKKKKPIVEGDEVEFDTKKGRKKGIAELVVNKYGRRTLYDFFDNMLYNYNNDEQTKQILDEGIKKLKLTLVKFDNQKFDELDDKTQKQWSELFRYMLNTDEVLTAGGDIVDVYIPYALDVDELEDLNIEAKNIVRVPKKGEEEKEVKPNKYPDPVTYSNKDILKVINEIREYQWKVNYPKTAKIYNEIQFRDLAEGNKYALMVLREPSEQSPYFTEYQNDIIGILTNRSTSFPRYVDYVLEDEISSYSIAETWVDFESKATDSYGLFTTGYAQIYDFKIPKDVAEFQKTIEKTFKPMNLNSESEIVTLVEAQKTKINTFKLQAEQLYDQQVFDELVQEVRRTMEKLQSEEIRSGASYVARANTFANGNADYIGNAMLSIFQDTDEEQLKNIDIKFRPSERAIAEAKRKREEEALKRGETLPISEEKQKLLNRIADLEETLQFQEGEDLIKLQTRINDLKETLEFV